MTERTCETCRFWKGDQHGGQCRRRAPIVVVKQWDEIDDDEVLRVCEVVSHCPKVGPQFWCGEWEPRVEVFPELEPGFIHQVPQAPAILVTRVGDAATIDEHEQRLAALERIAANAITRREAGSD